MSQSSQDERPTFKIGEACRTAGIQPYVLRYWESEFPTLAESKTASGPRVYTRDDVDLICRIKALLYEEGYTIAGARKKLEAERAGVALSSSDFSGEQATPAVSPAGGDPATDSSAAPFRPRPPRRTPRSEPATTRIDTPAASGLNAAAAEIEAAVKELEGILELLENSSSGRKGEQSRGTSDGT